ncbi:mRNA-capping enzyme-like [Aphidius gifuensis]|uniref:mRNA-capping enzyme-like n=1 Tax=Aphidius gifuensis TaxID=684658 RepID=UPI001CDD2DFA|nr:mRNA-capping enzyme-like [Aphidius gifuensis]XP_044012384.1 mRNA-capping enzyme-like [Aphidius gifuensis]
MANRNSGRGPIPERWLNCPRRAGRLIHDKFLAFKTPLSQDFDDQVPEACRFNIDFLFNSAKGNKWKLGLWIDLTNTSRFYDRQDIESYGCKYLKLPCRGHGETPDEQTTRAFVEICKQFIKQHPLEIIGVHCTHGFNRTGFLIISYMVEIEDNSLDAAMAKFSVARPPGIYKNDYIEELYKRYEEGETPPPPPPRPDWCYEYDNENDDDDDDNGINNDNDDCDDDNGVNGGGSNPPPAKRRKSEFKHKNPVFMIGVPGVSPVTDGSKLSHVQKRVQDICKWTKTGFPGSQPVSMGRINITLLQNKPYRVSWKADGTRYMLMIQANGESFFIDRDNSVFKIDVIKFPHYKETHRLLYDTLLDGEMVIDRADGKEYPRYLAYDIIMYDNKDVSKLGFYPDRYNIIKYEVMAGRHRAISERKLIREKEPFSIRLKEFWPVMQADRLLSDKFSQQLGHEPDGLIFQPSKEPYCPGPSDGVLKWKPSSLNSVDFKLKIVMEGGVGIVSKKVGQLFVGSQSMPFAQIKINKTIKELDNKIIECKYDNGQWIFMRERTDKSFPNSYDTAMSVCKTIRDPITTEFLLNFIREKGFVDDSDLMPPPAKLQSNSSSSKYVHHNQRR